MLVLIPYSIVTFTLYFTGLQFCCCWTGLTEYYRFNLWQVVSAQCSSPPAQLFESEPWLMESRSRHHCPAKADHWPGIICRTGILSDERWRLETIVIRIGIREELWFSQTIKSHWSGLNICRSDAELWSKVTVVWSDLFYMISRLTELPKNSFRSDWVRHISKCPVQVTGSLQQRNVWMKQHAKIELRRRSERIKLSCSGECCEVVSPAESTWMRLIQSRLSCMGPISFPCPALIVTHLTQHSIISNDKFGPACN